MDRKYSIDVLRIISAVAVIIIHVVSAPVVNCTGDVSQSLVTGLALIPNLMYWSVPVFFMITGYCLVKKPCVGYRYCFSHVLKYVCVLFTVGLSFSLMEEIFTCRTVNFKVVARSVLNVISGDLWDHMWFVYAIIGIYLIMPVVHSFMKNNPAGSVILTVILIVFNILIPAFGDVFRIGISIPFGGYLTYVCIGGAVAELKISRGLSIAVYGAGVLSCLWIILGTKSVEFTYSHPAVCLMAVSIFLLFSRLEVRESRALMSLSKCTWGVYLIHPLFINVLFKVLEVDVLSSGTYVYLTLILTGVSLTSFMTIYVLRMIPIVRKLF